MHDPTFLPPGLPVPIDDGACDHLVGTLLPPIELGCTGPASINLHRFRTDARLSEAVLFFYPRTGVPGQPPSLGFDGAEWDTIPGARGCTPQSCGFRDQHAQFERLGVTVFGVSTNTVEHQAEFAGRMHIPFPLISDSSLQLTRGLRLPTFEFPVESGGPTTLLHRMAWFVAQGRVQKVWYPVFPPNENASRVLAWLNARPRVRPATPADLPWIRTELHRHWHSTAISSRGKVFAADQLPALIAVVGEVGNERAGLLTYSLESDGCEVVTLSSAVEGRGVGAELLRAVECAALDAACERVFLTTTNDNLHALGFYQRRGWNLAALHKGGMDAARRTKPEIPWMGLSRIRLRDEIELELRC